LRTTSGSPIGIWASSPAAFAHYKRALELNPRHRGAHEYVGEAYLLVGALAKAEEHLAALQRICLLPCEELADLERDQRVSSRRAARPMRALRRRSSWASSAPSSGNVRLTIARRRR
jgi:hypothetical protein